MSSRSEAFDAFIAFYPTTDLEATRHFYTHTLGLELARDQGRCLIFRVAGGGYLGFCRRDTAPAGQGLILTLVTDAVDAIFERLDGLNVETESAPKTNHQYAIYHFFAHDPNGYRFEVQRFEDPLR